MEHKLYEVRKESIMNFEEFKNKIITSFPDDTFDESLLKHIFACACTLREFDNEQEELIKQKFEKAHKKES